jgi:hypothetical protein
MKLFLFRYRENVCLWHRTDDLQFPTLSPLSDVSGRREITFLIHSGIFVEDEKKAMIGGEIATNVYV